MYIRENWTNGQLRLYIQRRNERLRREREHYEKLREGGGKTGKREAGFMDLATMARKQGKVKRLRQRTRPDTLEREAHD